MDEYEATIGLEIHAELKTVTKMFCSSRNDPYNAAANTHICPVCLAHPGTLPVINKEAVRQVLRVGIALGSRLADYTEFDRKNYFYPDLPKGYQLSQFEFPLVSGGKLLDVDITRVHLEEDTASSIHDDASGSTRIDYNRAGVPLMELVTEPVIKSAAQAGAFARELQLTLRYLGASDANMERGEMRVEANVSVAPKGQRSAGYVEIKNLNSFKAMERAVEYEIKRQTALVKAGGTIEKQTLGWDDVKQATFPQRTKEGSADYRYFPDPDLPSLKLSEIPEFAESSLRSSIGELPHERRGRYIAIGIKPDDADAFVKDTRFGTFFDQAAVGLDTESQLLAANYIANDLVKIVRDIEIPDTKTMDILNLSAPLFQKLIQMVRSGSISSRVAKDILLEMTKNGIDPEEYAKEHGLLVSNDTGALKTVVEKVIAENPTVVSDFRAGKAAALEFLLGQCMRHLRGAGDPGVLRAMLTEHMQ
ncbi:MAG: Asp-tRNA(Asn)/Glu-tRNA(Gln) amidotransferase subunit GatB [Candidatus Pacebacteria bacterium]|nr:Asp-tRNA(Asn)/Glu-tRNA(Gln) amidotransferase subunit GatB [Candidatus Paceibacterota bacterium]